MKFEAPLSARELRHRLSQPGFLPSFAARVVRESWDRFSPSQFARLYRQVRPLTMCSNARLRGLHNAVNTVVEQGVPGDLVECGVARGGSAAMMALTLKLRNARRTLWLCDTFAGLPVPSENDPDFDVANLYTGSCVGTVEAVRGSFGELGIENDIEFLPGLFQDTLPAAPIHCIAVLHVDGDWHDSVKATLDALYDRVSPGGIVQIDDYGHWQGARRAVDDFFAPRGLSAPLSKLDFAGRQFVKGKP